MFANSKKVTTFAPAIEREILDKKEYSIASLFLSCFVQGIQYSRAQFENGSDSADPENLGESLTLIDILSILLPADILAYFDLNLPTLLF